MMAVDRLEKELEAVVRQRPRWLVLDGRVEVQQTGQVPYVDVGIVRPRDQVIGGCSQAGHGLDMAGRRGYLAAGADLHRESVGQPPTGPGGLLAPYLPEDDAALGRAQDQDIAAEGDAPDALVEGHGGLLAALGPAVDVDR